MNGALRRRPILIEKSTLNGHWANCGLTDRSAANTGRLFWEEEGEDKVRAPPMRAAIRANRPIAHAITDAHGLLAELDQFGDRRVDRR